MKIYLAGALKNLVIPLLASQLRERGHIVYDDWFAAGVEADSIWRDYERARGRTFKEAIKGEHARTALNMDATLIRNSDLFVLVLPAGRSAHIELGYAARASGVTAVLMEGEPDRFDLMYGFADHIFMCREELFEYVK